MNIALTGPDNAPAQIPSLASRDNMQRLMSGQPRTTSKTFNPQKCPGAVDAARGVATAPGGDHMNDSTPTPPDNADAYAALIKPGDAIETPDGELWVVTSVSLGDKPVLTLASACRDAAGRIYADAYEAATTSVPRDLVTKVADARQVRRP